MKAIQILAVPETDNYNPFLVALGEDGNLYSIPVLAAFKGGEWQRLPLLPDVEAKVDA